MVSPEVLMRSSGRKGATCAIVLQQHAGGDRVALGMVGIQEAVWRCLVDHLGQLPSQIQRILHTGVEALSSHRAMHMCGVAGQQHPSFAVGRGPAEPYR